MSLIYHKDSHQHDGRWKRRLKEKCGVLKEEQKEAKAGALHLGRKIPAHFEMVKCRFLETDESNSAQIWQNILIVTSIEFQVSAQNMKVN